MPVNLYVAQTLQNRNVHRAVLENGMTVLTVENPAADIIAARIFIRAGSRYEVAAQTGISHLLSAVITKGTANFSSQQIAEQVESVGASLGTDAASDYCLLSLKTVSADFVEMLKLAAEILRSPIFPAPEVELERRLTLQGIRSMQEQPFAIGQNQLRQAMYQQHPYAFSGLGTEATVSQLTQADLQTYHQTYFRPDNLVISIAGRILPEEAIALVDQVFGDWHPPQQDGQILPLPSPELPPVTSDPRPVITVQETQQAILMLGYLAPAVKNADYAALKLLSTYLSNGLSSRLFVELREKQGLAYEVSGFYPTRLDTSHFVVYMGTAPINTAVAIEGLRREVDRLSQTLLSADELQASKNKLLGQYALGKQTNAQIAQTFGWYETLGLGIEFDQTFQQAIANVTAEAAQDAACRYLGEPYLSFVGPAIAVDALSVITSPQ
ncbi:insulinase family protein [Oscillatoria sp. FACHB-1407]|uniref:M16 family metallopeptidase n=1 Tax=Oscillatoria sp. FACHB-1407 TaxID=2692847 RepID=UPI0016863C83|nr:pitrilysin family protein [Oscillatoria sp. FACHB-1407]MBD2464963.1 insulinase family protein [Oscillatoria sp. FACHB-1407]